MAFSEHPSPIDYLVIGHMTRELTPSGRQTGGAALYAGLTAHALGLRVGIVTSRGEDLPLDQTDGVRIVGPMAEETTTFERLNTPTGRQIVIRNIAPRLGYHHVPEHWRNAPIVHLAPVAQEVEPAMVRRLSGPFLGVSIRGWIRGWDHEGKTYLSEWPEMSFVLGRTDAAVVCETDLYGDEQRIDELVNASRLLAVTDDQMNVRVFWEGEVRRFEAPDIPIVDATGGGDVFAALFFVNLDQTKDPWHAARYATYLARLSMGRRGLEGVPTYDDIVRASNLARA